MSDEYYAVVDILADCFLTTKDGQWLFESKAEAEAEQMVAGERLKISPFALTSFDSKPDSPEAAIEQVRDRVNNADEAKLVA
jgi:hypothetical protein